MTESPDSSSSSSSAAVRRRPEPVPPLSSPGAGTRKWNAESRWRAFLRPSDYRTPDSFDEASERFSLNLPYYLTQYAAIGALTVLAGALLSGGVAFVLAVVVALLLVIIAISLTSRIELANSTRFLVFLLVTTRSSSPHPTPPLSSSVSGFHTALHARTAQWSRWSSGSPRTCASAPSASSSGFPVCCCLSSSSTVCVLSSSRLCTLQSVSCTVCSRCPLRTRRPSFPALPSSECALLLFIPNPEPQPTTHSTATYPHNPQQERKQRKWRYNNIVNGKTVVEKAMRGRARDCKGTVLIPCHRLRSAAARARQPAARAAAAAAAAAPFPRRAATP